MPTVRFTRESKVVECAGGETLRQVAIKSGVQLYPGLASVFNCRGLSTCGTCRVHVLKGMENLSPPTFREKCRVAASWFKFGHEHEVRLACQCRVHGDIEVVTQPEFNWFGEDR